MTISKYIYGRPRNERDKSKSGPLARTLSQRSYSMNSTSLNTCSSICSMQPFSTQNHQQTFRYFSDSKRPLVVSFRRVNKVKLPNALEKSIDRCNSICDIHRVVEFDENKMSMKSRYCRRLSPYKFDSHIDMRQRTQFDNDSDESPHRENKISITYPKEKFHGNAKLLFTINDDILKHNRHWYDSINATTNLFAAKAKIPKDLRNDIDLSRDDNKSKIAHKSTSTPSLSKLQTSMSNEIEMRERKQSFVSILNVRANETLVVKNSKSY